MASITAVVNRNPSSVHEARRQWQAALAAAECAERVYNAAIEKGLPEHEHSWARHQNVTSRGYAMKPYEACECGAARQASR